MQPMSTRPPHGPARTRTGRRRPRGILALLAVLACLAGFAVAKVVAPSSGSALPRPPATSPAGALTPRAGTAAPSQLLPGAVSWPAAGGSAAGSSGSGIANGPGATRPVPIASVAKVMTAYVVLREHPLPANASGPAIEV